MTVGPGRLPSAAPGDAGTVTVEFDARGIPTVTAPDRAGAAYGLGRATARDRLFQLDLYRRRALGRTAELFGPAAVPHDVVQRTLDLPTVAERIVGELPARHRELIEAYAEGVNDQLRERTTLPVEFRLLGFEPEPWRAADSTAVALLLAQMLGGDGAEIRMRAVMAATLPAWVVEFLLPPDGPYAVDVTGAPVAGAQEGLDPALAGDLARLAAGATPGGGTPVVGADESPFGSNAWAVSGRRTADGRAILANDMHLPLTAPSILYRVALRYAGHRIDGVVVPGLPVLVAGSSAHLAWGATRLTAANVDLVEISVPDGEPDRYRTGDGIEPFRIRTATVGVRGADPVAVTVRATRWGPVHAPTTVAGVEHALRWRPLEPGGLDLGLADLAECRDVRSACEVVTAAAAPPLNVLLADADGRIAWTVTGSFPLRGEPVVRPVRPARGERSWDRCRPAEELPRVVDPPGGLLVSANNLTPGHRAVPLTDNGFSAARARRVGRLLAGSAPADEELMRRVQLDTAAEFFEFYRDLARSALAGDPEPPAALREVAEAVAAWDGTAGPDARGLGLLVLFRENLRETLFAALLADCRRADPAFRYVWHDHETPLRALLCATAPPIVPAPYPDRRTMLRAHLGLSAAMLRAAVGDRPLAEVRWGDLNRAGIRHPLSALSAELAATFDLPDVPLPGCAESVHAAHPGFGPAVRLVAAPGHPDRALLHLPGGQSGEPGRPTYADQFHPWWTGEPAPLRPGPTVERMEYDRAAPVAAGPTEGAR